MELDVPLEQIKEGLSGFSGVDRRFQIRGETGRVTVIDDYGHHPTEIRATLQAARMGVERVLVLFQPHRYTRTQALLEDFARSFHQADCVWVTDIYAASEQPIAGVTAEALVEAMRQFGHRGAEYRGGIAAAVDSAVAEAKPGDLVLTLGAGSISQAGEGLLRGLESKLGEART